LLKFRYLLQFIIQTHCQQNKKIKRANQIFSEVYGTTLRRLVAAKPYTPFPFWKFFFPPCIVFFPHSRRKLPKRKKNFNLYLLSLYLSFCDFSSSIKKKKTKKKKGGGGRALRL
jgi:hypothetical protein